MADITETVGVLIIDQEVEVVVATHRHIPTHPTRTGKTHTVSILIKQICYESYISDVMIYHIAIHRLPTTTIDQDHLILRHNIDTVTVVLHPGPPLLAAAAATTIPRIIIALITHHHIVPTLLHPTIIIIDRRIVPIPVEIVVQSEEEVVATTIIIIIIIDDRERPSPWTIIT